MKSLENFAFRNQIAARQQTVSYYKYIQEIKPSTFLLSRNFLSSRENPPRRRPKMQPFFFPDELVHEKEKFKAISDELDQTFAEMSGY